VDDPCGCRAARARVPGPRGIDRQGRRADRRGRARGRAAGRVRRDLAPVLPGVDLRGRRVGQRVRQAGLRAAPGQQRGGPGPGDDAAGGRGAGERRPPRHGDQRARALVARDDLQLAPDHLGARRDPRRPPEARPDARRADRLGHGRRQHPPRLRHRHRAPRRPDLLGALD
ncbi:MAG: hypothetical protein AVDCRST_MAG79-2697, partial [uncultured Thermoleophilia bacterium]